MKKILNITNGDCAVVIMEEAKIPGVFLPWRDILHDGPVPEGLSLEALSEIRAQFIIDCGWGSPKSIKDNFIARDNELKSYKNYEKIILWFEHDLYDQLQILQILDWFYQNAQSETELTIICTDQYLGMLKPAEMEALFQYEQSITEQHLVLASRAWSAFRSPDPKKWHDLLDLDSSVLPFLEGAIIRLMEEYPNCSNGLSRTAHQALMIIAEGEKRPGRVFGRYQESEDGRFLGDSSFWLMLYELLESDPPLLELTQGGELTLPNPNQELTITPTGSEVLSGSKNWLEMIKINRWIGGVHLTTDNLWCWKPDSSTLENPWVRVQP